MKSTNKHDWRWHPWPWTYKPTQTDGLPRGERRVHWKVKTEVLTGLPWPVVCLGEHLLAASCCRGERELRDLWLRYDTSHRIGSVRASDPMTATHGIGKPFALRSPASSPSVGGNGGAGRSAPVGFLGDGKLSHTYIFGIIVWQTYKFTINSEMICFP